MRDLPYPARRRANSLVSSRTLLVTVPTRRSDGSTGSVWGGEAIARWSLVFLGGVLVVVILPAEIEAAQGGDSAALAMLMCKVDIVLERLLAPLERTIPEGVSIDHEGLRQELRLLVLRSLSALRAHSGGMLVAWLERTVRHRFLDEMRSTRRRCRRESDLMEEIEAPEQLEVADPDSGPAESVALAERLAAVSRAMKEIPTGIRRALVLRMEERLGFAEIATRLALPSANAARCPLRRALECLRAAIVDARGRGST
jgi:RNA polymerase sigma factor (sigma-70 family)